MLDVRSDSMISSVLEARHLRTQLPNAPNLHGRVFLERLAAFAGVYEPPEVNNARRAEKKFSRILVFTKEIFFS